MKKYMISTLLLVSFFVMQGCAGSTGALGDNSVSRKSGELVDLGNGTCQEMRTGIMWQIDKSKRVRSLAEAEDYVAQLNLAGYDDWRLPTVAELFKLHLLFDVHANGDCTIERDGNYWSDEPDLQGRVGAWELDDNCDPERQYIPKEAGYVRAIRM